MRHGLILLSVSLILGTLVGPAGAWYPRSVQVELGTATW
jgi:hypothetical protein